MSIGRSVLAAALLLPGFLGCVADSQAAEQGTSCAVSPFGDRWQISGNNEIYAASASSLNLSWVLRGDPQDDGRFDLEGSGNYGSQIASNTDLAITAADMEGDGTRELLLFFSDAGGVNRLGGVAPDSSGSFLDTFSGIGSRTNLAVAAGNLFGGPREQVMMAGLNASGHLALWTQADQGDPTDSTLFSADGTVFGQLFDSTVTGRLAQRDNRRNLDLAMGDLDGDGAAEAVVAYVLDGQSGVRLNIVQHDPAQVAAGDFNTSSMARLTIGTGDVNSVGVATGDVDRDGVDEVVVFYSVRQPGDAPGPTIVRIYDVRTTPLAGQGSCLQSGGSFCVQLKRQIDLGRSGNHGDVTVADTDGDFAAEIVVAYDGDGRVQVDTIDLDVSSAVITGHSFHNRFSSPDARHTSPADILVEAADFSDAGKNVIIVALQDRDDLLDSLFLEDVANAGGGMVRRIPEPTIDGDRNFVIEFPDLSSDRPYMAVGDKDNDAETTARYGPLTNGVPACQESLEPLVASAVFVPPHWGRIRDESLGQGQVANGFIGTTSGGSVDQAKSLSTSTEQVITGYVGAGIDAGVVSAKARVTAKQSYELGQTLTNGVSTGTTESLATSANDDFVTLESTLYVCYNYQFERNGVAIDGAARACELQSFNDPNTSTQNTLIESVVLDAWDTDRRYRRSANASLRWTPVVREWANLTQINAAQAFQSSSAQSAANAIDNNAGTDTQTSVEAAPWLMIDLGGDQLHRISKLRIVNSNSRFIANNLENYSIFVGTEDFRGLPSGSAQLATHPSVTYARVRQPQAFASASFVTQNGETPVLGRYIKLLVESPSLLPSPVALGVAELQVFGPNHVDPDRFPRAVRDLNPNDGRFEVDIFDPALGTYKQVSVNGTLLLNGSDTSVFSPAILEGRLFGPPETIPSWQLSSFATTSQQLANSFSSTSSIGVDIDVEAGLLSKIQFGGGVEFSSGVAEEESRTTSVTSSFEIGGSVTGFPVGSNFPSDCYYQMRPYYYRKREVSDFGFEHDFLVVDYIVPDGLNRASSALDRCRPRSAAPDTQLLLAHWKFENNLLDSTGNGFDLSFEGAGNPVYTAGVLGKAIDLRSVNSYLNLSDTLLDGHPSCAISAWVNIASFDPGDPAESCCNAVFTENGFSRGALHFNIALNGGSGSYEFALSEGFSNLQSAVPGSGIWHHVAYNYNAASQFHEIFVDGVATGAGASIGGPAMPGCGSGLGYTIGAWDRSEGQVDMTRFLDGQLDDIRVFGRSLTAEEVAALAGLQPLPGGEAVFCGRFEAGETGICN